MEKDNQMLDFIKALANMDRLKIVGFLAQNPATADEVGHALSLSPRQVFNHLAFLEFAGVIHKKGERYAIDRKKVEQLAREQSQGKLPKYAPPESETDERARVLATFIEPDGSIRQIPNSRTQPRRFKIILEHVAASFVPGRVYREKEVNDILRSLHADTAGLRRDLVDHGFLARKRDGSAYWRLEPGDDSTASPDANRPDVANE
jgi:hypothetical protein